MKYLFVLVFICLFIYSSAQEEKKVWTKAKVEIREDGLARMSKLGIAVDDGYIKKGEFIIRDFSAQEMNLLQENGFVFEVLEPDVQKYYKDRNKTGKKKEDAVSKSIMSLSCQNSGYAVPQNFSLGSMGGFFTLAEINAQLDSIRLRFPTLASQKMPLSSTITTYEGRVPNFIRLSNNPDVLQTKPRLMYVGLTHAREPAGMQQLFYFMYYLLENYAQDKTVQFILDNCEIYVVPCLNVDGYLYNQTTDPSGGGMHRKNVSPNGSSNQGVDLNRNYGYQWGYDDVGSSPDPSMDTYRGTAGFSEAETQMMKAFCEEYQFTLGIDYHCYSNVLLFPWGYTSDLLTPDSSLYNAYSELMTRQNAYPSGLRFLEYRIFVQLTSRQISSWLCLQPIML
jgi:hypothetical protein